MTKNIIHAAALAATLSLGAATTARAEPLVTYRDDGQYSVWQARLDDGTPMCYLKAYQQTSAGSASWGLAKQSNVNGPLSLYYSEAGLNWTGGNVAFQIDGYPRHTAIMQPSTGNPGMMFADLDSNASVFNFIKELYAGNYLYILTNAGTRTFSLANSQPAMQDMLRCIDEISGSGGTLPPAVSAPAPAYNSRTPKFRS